MCPAPHPTDQSPRLLTRARGRAARSNTVGRYETQTREEVEDGWNREEDGPPLRTEVRIERPRRAITRNTSPDVPFDRSLNPYRGCEHGCIYCFARPTHAWLGMSPGLDFETRLIARPDAPDLLAKELSKPGYTPRTLAIGTNTDPYQPIEKDHGIMRAVLQVLREFRHPVGIVTKGTLVERDVDILAEMARDGLAHVGISITTLDRDVARSMEPRVPSPARRLAALRTLATAGIPTKVMASPMVPALTDHELEAILEAGAEAGAQAASTLVLRLPLEVAPLFRDWVAAEFPDRAERVIGRVRELHGGRDYDPKWGTRMTGQGTWATLLRQRYKVACKRLGLKEKLPDLRNDLFRVPPRPGDQLSLF